jgi:hypothetical protein
MSCCNRSASTTLIYTSSSSPTILASTPQPLPPVSRHATIHDARIVALGVSVVLTPYQVCQCYHHLIQCIVRFYVCPWIARSQQKRSMIEHK